jgi:hypothetical protein
MAAKRTIEVFSAGCAACMEAIEMVRRVARGVGAATSKLQAARSLA